MRTVAHCARISVLLWLATGCSGSVEPDDVTGGSDDDSLSQQAGADAAETLSLGRAEQAHSKRRGHRRRHHHPKPPPPPRGEACEVAGQTFPDGSAVPSGDSCNSCGCNDGAVLCTLVACEPVFCAAFVENPDGVCSRFPLDPCISQDPDCLPEPASCEAAGQTFPDGSVIPSGDSCNSCSCSDGSVICTLALCEPVACAEFIENPDGVCSRFPLDPCKFQDPDCSEPEGGPEPSAP
jgi:hypothetical protein